MEYMRRLLDDSNEANGDNVDFDPPPSSVDDEEPGTAVYVNVKLSPAEEAGAVSAKAMKEALREFGSLQFKKTRAILQNASQELLALHKVAAVADKKRIEAHFSTIQSIDDRVVKLFTVAYELRGKKGGDMDKAKLMLLEAEEVVIRLGKNKSISKEHAQKLLALLYREHQEASVIGVPLKEQNAIRNSFRKLFEKLSGKSKEEITPSQDFSSKHALPRTKGRLHR